MVALLHPEPLTVLRGILLQTLDRFDHFDLPYLPPFNIKFLQPLPECLGKKWGN